MKTKNFGMSLVEIVIALFIAGIAIAPVVNLLTTTNKETSTSIYQVMAAYYSNEIIEQSANRMRAFMVRFGKVLVNLS